jgi:hypothetical protein
VSFVSWNSTLCPQAYKHYRQKKEKNWPKE